MITVTVMMGAVCHTFGTYRVPRTRTPPVALERTPTASVQDVTEVTDRTYWTTREAADACGLTQTTLRWYERIGLLERVERGSDLRRRFTRGDLNWLLLISRLRATGMPVREMLRYAELARRAGTERERLEIFEAHRCRITAALAVQQECLTVLDHKIEIYRRALPADPPTTARRPATEDTPCTPHSSAN